MCLEAVYGRLFWVSFIFTWHNLWTSFSHYFLQSKHPAKVSLGSFVNNNNCSIQAKIQIKREHRKSNQKLWISTCHIICIIYNQDLSHSLKATRRKQFVYYKRKTTKELEGSGGQWQLRNTFWYFFIWLPLELLKNLTGLEKSKSLDVFNHILYFSLKDIYIKKKQF